MRKILAVLWAFRHPVGITTRGTMTGRDIDLIAPMAAQGPAAVPISGTTPDAGLARKREPRVPAPRRRLPVIERLARAGIPVRIQISPLIPAPTGHEHEAVMQTGRDAGATAANCSPLRLPPEVPALFREWPEATFPVRAARIMGRARELHGGCPCAPGFGTRLRGQAPRGVLIRRCADVARKRLGHGEGLRALWSGPLAPPQRVGDQFAVF